MLSAPYRNPKETPKRALGSARHALRPRCSAQIRPHAAHRGQSETSRPWGQQAGRRPGPTAAPFLPVRGAVRARGAENSPRERRAVGAGQEQPLDERGPSLCWPLGRAHEASRSWGGDPRARCDPTARRGRGKSAGPLRGAHPEAPTRPFPVSQRISHPSSRPLAPVRVTDPTRTAPAPGRPPRPRTVRAGGARPLAAPRC